MGMKLMCICGSEHEVTAAYADPHQAERFLKDLGFAGLKLKAEKDNSVVFTFTDDNQELLDNTLGDSKAFGSGLNKEYHWKFGTEGYIVINRNTVELKNSEKPANIKVKDSTEGRSSPKSLNVPVTPKAPGSLRLPQAYLDRLKNKSEAPEMPTHLVPTGELDKSSFVDLPGLPPKPQYKELESPDIPGSRVTEKGAPKAHVPDSLKKEYLYCQELDNPQYRIKFMWKLWHYLNETKFRNKLPKPKHLGLIRNQKADKLDTRGHWFPLSHVLEIAPRVFNAHFDFFHETFLHEMCHQAVTDLDHRTDVGHGQLWVDWMERVGLNPLRYDPNPNETYMSKRELKNSPGALLRKTHNSYFGRPLQTGMQVTFVQSKGVYNSEKHNGRILGIIGYRWVIMYEDNEHARHYAQTISNNIFPYQGSKKPEETQESFNEALTDARRIPGFQVAHSPTINDPDIK